MYSIDKDSKGNCLISLRYFHALVNVESITGEICSVTYGTALVFGTTGTFIGKVNASSNDMLKPGLMGSRESTLHVIRLAVVERVDGK
jgi:hypothetical protein